MNRSNNGRETFLNKDEEVLLAEQGLLKDTLRSGWKPGRFYLTNERLLFFQPPNIKLQTHLADIVDVALEKKAVIIRTTNVLFLTYRKHCQDTSGGAGRGGIMKAWIAVKDVENWRRKVYERSLLKIDEETIDKVGRELDPKSQDILIHLWQNKHARIEKLAELIDAPAHMDVLLRIREQINPAAERVIGNSILSFEKSKFDSETGQKILFSWWVIGRRERKKEEKKVLSDIFDEGNYLNVIMEFPGVKEDDILFKLENKKITVSASSLNKKYHEEIDLPVEVDTEDFSKAFNNNVLEIKLKKVKSEVLKSG